MHHRMSRIYSSLSFSFLLYHQPFSLPLLSPSSLPLLYSCLSLYHQPFSLPHSSLPSCLPPSTINPSLPLLSPSSLPLLYSCLSLYHQPFSLPHSSLPSCLPPSTINPSLSPILTSHIPPVSLFLLEPGVLVPQTANSLHRSLIHKQQILFLNHSFTGSKQHKE